jgi:hypothetical protein
MKNLFDDENFLFSSTLKSLVEHILCPSKRSYFFLLFLRPTVRAIGRSLLLSVRPFVLLVQMIFLLNVSMSIAWLALSIVWFSSLSLVAFFFLLSFFLSLTFFYLLSSSSLNRVTTNSDIARYVVCGLQSILVRYRSTIF